MKNIFIISLVFLVHFCSFSIKGQSCFPEGIIFSTQSDLDDFAINYLDCETIGRVTIQGDNITSLEGLINIKKIDGSLIIHSCPALEEINWSSNLIEVTDSIYIGDNNGMLTIDGFDKLERTSHLLIKRNLILEDITGFSSLNEINENCNLSGEKLENFGEFPSLTKAKNIVLASNNVQNTMQGFNNIATLSGNLKIGSALIESVAGFSNLTLIEGNLECRVQDSIASFVGFSNLEKINGIFLFSKNSRLTDFRDFHSLKSVGGIVISSMLAIENFTGLEQLEKFENQLRISLCPNLQTLKGLQNAKFENGDVLVIGSNPLLSQCAIQEICKSLPENDFSSFIIGEPIGANGTGCNSNEEVLESCSIDTTVLNFQNL